MIDKIIKEIESMKTISRKNRLHHFKKVLKLFSLDLNLFKIIHIGGTNGKGSTVKYLEAILKNQNFKVGSFTSPYIVKFNERIEINGEFISDENIVYYYNMITRKNREIIKCFKRPLGFFEFCFLLSLLYFRDQRIDYLILEVGIGGLYDITNIVDPVASAVVSVSYDHIDILGPTLKDIYRNKLGIIKKKKPFFIFDSEEYHDLIVKTAKQRKGELHLINKSEIENITFDPFTLNFSYHGFSYETSLIGYHQAFNAVIAIEIIKKLFPNLHETNINSSLKTTKWPGRMEVITKEPLTILDGAHNPEAIDFLVKALKSLSLNNLQIIFSASKNKEYEKMLLKLKTLNSPIYLVTNSNKRSFTSEDIQKLESQNVFVSTLPEVLEIREKNQKAAYVFTGSLFFVSEVRSKLVK